MKKVWDRLGIAFSSICAIHCVGVAFLPLLFPAIASYTHNPMVHIAVGITILFTSPLAFIPGYRKHGLTWIIAMALVGLVLIVAGMVLERNAAPEQISHGISILGSILLVLAHAKNLQHSHRHQHQCC
jgi:MerC mercury resistance protein